MFKKWNRILAFLLSIALVTTTFGSDFASAKVYAEENEIVEESDETEEPEEPKEETTIAELPAAEVIPQDELGGGNENGSGNSENDEEGTTPVVTSTEGNGEGTPTPGDPVDTTDQPEYELDEDGNPVLDENGNPKLKEKVAEEETEEEVVETEEEVDGIKIYYVVSDEDAGYVDNDSDVFAEGKEIVGSTAFENDGYTFLNWTDEDGNEVCDVPNFTPSASDLGVSEDAEGEESEDGEEEVKEVTFTANFKAIINKEVVREVEMDGVLITFSAEPGVLPNDAQFEVIRVYPNVDKAIEEDLSNELDKEIEVKETISFDINIYASSCATEDNEKGYIPLEDGIVEVTFSNVSEAVSSAADADTGLAVYHVDGSDVELQNYEEESTGDEISFDAEHFSTYTVTIYGTNGSAPSFKAKTYISGTNTEINTGASGTAANITVNGRKSANEVAPNLTALGYVFEKAVPADHTGRVITEFERNSSSKIKYWYNEGRNSSTFNSSTGQSANTIRVYFYYKKVVTVTAKLIDKDVNEIAQPESFVINTEADLAKIKPSNLEITAANGSKYSYKGAFVYDSTYSEWGEVQSYELYENDVYAIYGDGIYDYVQLTNANHSYPYVYFEYEPASTSGSFNAQVVYEYSNGYGSTSTITLADPITFTVDENFNVPNDIKPAETDIYKDGTHYQYEKAQVKDGYTWYEVTGYSRSGASVIATYRSGNSNKTAKLGTNNFRFRYKKIAPNANTSLGHHLDLGFKNESEFLKYKNAGASIKAIVNGKSYDMDIVQQSGSTIPGYDVDLDTWEYRLSKDKHGQRFNVTDKIIFQLIYDGQTYEIDATSHNQEASDRCVNAHKGQSEWGFDYIFSFEDKFTVVGNLIYNKNDGSNTMPVADTQSDVGVNDFTFTVNDISSVGFMSGASHKDGEEYRFIGWSEDTAKTTPDITLAEIQAGKTITVPKNGRKELYAVWEHLSYPITYLDGYNADGQNQIAQYTQNHGATTQKPADPTRDLYVFDGWYVTGDANQRVVDPTTITVTGPASYTAKWTRQYPEGQLKISANSQTKTYDGNAINAGFTVTNKPDGFDSRFEVTGVTYKNKDTEATESALSITDASTLNYEIATYRIVDKNNRNDDVTDYFNPVLSKDGTLKVNPVEINVTTGTQSWKYDGQEHRNYDISYNGKILTRDTDNYVSIKPINGKNETIKLRTNAVAKFPIIDASVDNVLEEVGDSNYSNGAKAQNYTIKCQEGKLSITVAEAAFKIKAQDQTFTYDGTRKTHNVVTTVTKPEGYEDFTIEANVTAGSYVQDFSNAAAGAETVTVTNEVDRRTIKVYTVIDGVKTDVTDNFDVTKITSENGTLTLNKRAITIKSDTAQKEYNGTPLQAPSVSITAGELVSNQAIADLVTISNYKSITEATTGDGVDNTYDHEEKDLAKNYKITYEYGKLKITQRTASIKVKAREVEKKYDGRPLSATDLKDDNGNAYIFDLVEGSPASGDKLVVITSGSITNYGTVTHKVESVKVMRGEQDVTSSYQNISAENGTLSITKRNVTLTSATWTKEYDGTPLTNESGLATSANPQAPNKGVTIGGDGFVDGEGVDSFDFTGSQTLPDTSKNAFTYTLKKGTTEGENGNYIIAKTEGDLTVTGRQTKYAVKVKANSDTVKYDGVEHPVSGFVTGGDPEDAALTNVKNTAKGLEFTEGDVKFYVTGISASLSKKDVLRKIDSTDVESYTVEVNGEAVIKDENGNAVTDQFDVTVLDGTLTINPRNVTLTSASGEREYDGTELTSAWLVANNKAYVNNELVDKEVVVTGDGFADKEGATYEVTGSQTYVGGETGNNDFTYTLKDNTKACNYNISTVDGTLTVTNRTEKIDLDLTANSGEFFYNGEERTVSGFKTTTFIYNGRTYHVSGLVSTRTETDVNYDATKKAEKSYPVSVTGTAKVEVEDGDKLVDVTDQCDVEVKTYGTLLIKQRNVTMTSASGEKEYDGTALTSAWLVANNKATVDGKPVTAQVIENTYNSETGEGFANNEGATYTVTGSQTRVGGDPENNTFTYTLNQGTKASNYNITTVNGTLKVTGRDQKYKITVTAKSGTFTYDGTAHEVSGFVTGEGTPYTETTNGLEFYEGNVKYYVAGISASGSATNVNDAGVVAITGTLGVFDSDNENVTDQFDVTTVNGKITIEKRKVFLKSSSFEKDYDGTALTNAVGLILDGKSGTEQPLGVSEYTPEGEDAKEIGFVAGQGATYNLFTGTVTLPGDDNAVDNVFDYTLSDGTTASNYVIDKKYGTLKVNGRKNPYAVSLVANSKEEMYNGSAITAEGFDAEKSSVAFTETEDGKLKFTGENGVEYYISGVTASGSGTNVTLNGYTVTAVKTNSFKVTNAAGYDLTAQFNVTVENGLLTITKRNVTITSASGEKEYDGTALTSAWLVEKNKATIDGKPVNTEVVVSGDGFVEGEGATYSVTGSQTYVGGETGNNDFTYALKDGTNAVNYNISTVYGTLTVKGRTNKYQVTVKANSKEFTYDGDNHTVSGFVTSEIVEGRAFTNTSKGLKFTENGVNYYITGITASETQKAVKRDSVDEDAGSYDVNVDGTPVVKDEKDKDVTDQFDVHTHKGTLKINPRSITLTAASGEKEYDGTPLDSKWLVDHKIITADEVIVQTGDGFVKNDGFKTLTTQGSAFLANQTEDNQVVYELNDDTVPTNYDISTVNGSLHVKNRGAKFEITVYAASGEETYDGTEKSVTGFEKVVYDETEFEVADDELKFTLNGQEFKVSGLTASGATATDVKRVGSTVGVAKVNSITGTAVVIDASRNDVTNQFDVSVENGGLTINPRKVTLVAGSDEKYFDGKPLKSATYYIKTGEGIDGFAVHDGINEKSGITVKVLGSQKFAGTSDNVITDVIFNKEIAKEDNYIVTKENGKLTVNNRPGDQKIKLIITVNVDDTGKNYIDKVYNGEMQNVKVDVVITGDGTIESVTEEEKEPVVIEIDEPLVQEETANEQDTAKAILQKLLSIGTITAYAMEDDEAYTEVSDTVDVGGIVFNVSGIKLSGGKGINVGPYPVKIDTTNLNVTLDETTVTENFEAVIVKVKRTEDVDDAEETEKTEEVEAVEATDDNIVGMLTITPAEAEVRLRNESYSKVEGSADPDYRSDIGVAVLKNTKLNEEAFTTIIDDVTIAREAGEAVRSDAYLVDVAGPEAKGNFVYTYIDSKLTITAAPSDDDDDDTPSGGDTTIPDAPVALAPSGAVLGAQRATGDGPAVLGARRAGTDDETNRMARVFAMVAAAAIAVTMLITGKKKDEEEEG